MSDGENNQGFWTGEQMRETDKGKAGDRKPPEPNPTVGLGCLPVTSEPTRFPNAYAMQYTMRKFFVTRVREPHPSLLPLVNGLPTE